MSVVSKDVHRVLTEGGFVRFIWHTGRKELITASGRSLRIDGRTYQEFLKTLAPKLKRSETGSMEERDLVIEWRQTGARGRA
jgi:hypothetical protein